MEQPRAVIYNRCSTEEESQKDALVKQVQESKNCVCEQGWKLVDTYVEAKSGTTVKGRSEYNRLYQDLEYNRFDIIVIKSQDRLMRNTKDWYLFLERMQRYGKKLYMYLERKFYTPEDALVTGIKAILAEEYSRELSKKINNAHRNRQREGKHFVFTNQTYGLKKLPDGTIAVHEEEAEMIRMVFRLSVDGYGTHTSAEILYRNGYTNRNGKMISPSVVRNIIRNPIYKGTVVQNRRHYEFESKRSIKNPESEWIIHEDVIPAIVDERLFAEANRALDGRKRRREGQRGDRNCDGQYMCYGNGGYHVLSGKIICGLCGEPFYRTVRHNKSGKVAEWKCSNYLHHGRRAKELRRDRARKTDRSEDGGCDNIHLDEKKLLFYLEQEYGQKIHEPDQQEIQDGLKRALGLECKDLKDAHRREQRKILEENLRQAECRQNLLLEKLLDGVIEDRDYQRKNQELQEKINCINGRLACLEEGGMAGMKEEAYTEDVERWPQQETLWRERIAVIISGIAKIKVYPDNMKIYIYIRALSETEESAEKGVEMCLRPSMQINKEWRIHMGNHAGRENADETAVLTVPQNCSTSHYPMAEAQKERILALVRERPETTAKEMAEEMGVSLSLVRRRICALKAEGKIWYNISKGRGEWNIIKTALDFND